MSAGQDLKDFKSELDIASGHIGEVRDGVTSGREGAEDVRWAVGTFGRVEQKAGEVADIIGGFADVLDLLGKVGPLGRVFRPLERVLKDIEDAVGEVEKKARKIDETKTVQEIKAKVDDAIGAYLIEYSEDGDDVIVSHVDPWPGRGRNGPHPQCRDLRLRRAADLRKRLAQRA